VVISTFPEALGTLEKLDGSIRFDFDERISERASGATLEQAISISPRTGAMRVKRGSRSLTVQVEGGFQPGIVYRVTLKPVVLDLFNNRLGDPFELVFSTGGDPVPTTIAGQVWDRLSGMGVDEAVVFATGDDGLVHQAVANREGIFAFRYVPAGRFSVSAFADQNRNEEIDSMEVQGAVPLEVAAGDTLLVDVSVLAPDTAAALIAEASAVDSMTLVLVFDDFLDPERPIEVSDIGLVRDGGAAPGVAQVFHEAAYREYVEAVTDSFARLDSIDAAQIAAAAAAVAAQAALSATQGDSLADGDSLLASDSVVVDSVSTTGVGEPTDTVTIRLPEEAPAPRVGGVGGRPPPGSPQAGGRQATASGRRAPVTLEPLPGVRPGRTSDGRRVLPGRRVVVVLTGGIEFDTPYEVRASSITNIFGLGGGGGVATLLWESPPPDTTVVDTLLAIDTTGVVDTLSVPDSGGGMRR